MTMIMAAAATRTRTATATATATATNHSRHPRVGNANKMNKNNIIGHCRIYLLFLAVMAVPAFGAIAGAKARTGVAEKDDGSCPTATATTATATTTTATTTTTTTTTTPTRTRTTALYPCTDEFLQDFWHDQYVSGYHIVCLEQEPWNDGNNNSNNNNKNEEEEEEEKDVVFVTLFRNGLKSLPQNLVLRMTQDLDENRKNSTTLQNLKSLLEGHLALPIPKKDSNFQPYAIFSPQGKRLTDGGRTTTTTTNNNNDNADNDDKIWQRLLRQGVVLVYQGGQFLWPGIYVGFQRFHVSLAHHFGTIEDPNDNDDPNDDARKVTITTLSLRPLVLEIQGFLSEEECTWIQQMALPHIQYSGVVLMDHDQGRPASDFRTSQSTFLSSSSSSSNNNNSNKRNENDPKSVLRDIEHRVASLTRIPRTHQEDVQVLRYGIMEKYDHHTDYFDPALYRNDPDTLLTIGYGRRNRLATVFWYISNVTSGGETVFPRAFGNVPHHALDCESGGLLVKPQQGKVIIFYSLLMSGRTDPLSLHGACPVKEGVKWAANKWVWNEPMNYVQ